MAEAILYTTKDARKEMNSKKVTGVEASIKKWQAIDLILNELFDNINSNCGLCIQYNDDYGSHCDECPIGQVRDQMCTNSKSHYQQVKNAIQDAIYHAKCISTDLHIIKRDEQTWN